MLSPRKNSICKSCQVTFPTDEELDLHSCLEEIKQETQDCDQDLSEEFLSTIIQYVDDLCNIIKNGDPNLERTSEVNKNLNKAVGYYRNKLSIFVSIDQKDNFDHGIKADLLGDNSDNGLEDNVEFKSEAFVEKDENDPDASNEKKIHIKRTKTNSTDKRIRNSTVV